MKKEVAKKGREPKRKRECAKKKEREHVCSRERDRTEQERNRNLRAGAETLVDIEVAHGAMVCFLFHSCDLVSDIQARITVSQSS